MNNIYVKLGENVKKLRKARNLSQEELAELIGRDVRTIIAIEAGTRNPTIETIQKLSQALKVKSADILPF